MSSQQVKKHLQKWKNNSIAQDSSLKSISSAYNKNKNHKNNLRKGSVVSIDLDLLDKLDKKEEEIEKTYMALSRPVLVSNHLSIKWDGCIKFLSRFSDKIIWHFFNKK